jgi:hypothetical protein
MLRCFHVFAYDKANSRGLELQKLLAYSCLSKEVFPACFQLTVETACTLFGPRFMPAKVNQ